MTKVKAIKNQILVIRDSGQVNMLDINGVQRLANRGNFITLVLFIEEHKNEYWKFIMTGDDKYLEVAE